MYSPLNILEYFIRRIIFDIFMNIIQANFNDLHSEIAKKPEIDNQTENWSEIFDRQSSKQGVTDKNK